MSKNNDSFFVKKNAWSKIKDDLLACYLPQYFQKLLVTGRPIFYVDCFAGKGCFDDGNDGSPRIALQIRDTCIEKSRAQKPKIEACFIDLHYGDELHSNITDFNNRNGIPQVVSGKYEEEIVTLLQNMKGWNIFLYIDPYGIKALDYSLFAKFADFGFSSIELLVNMNSFGFFRDACRVMSVDYNNDEAFRDLDDLVEYDPTKVDTNKQSEELLISIVGGDYWKSIVQDYKEGKINGYQAEKRFSNEYKHQLRKKYTYVLDMPICIKNKQHPKYRMIHVSNHEEGCILMADNMCSRSDELFIEIQNHGQGNLFSTDVQNNIIDEIEIRQKMMTFLSTFPDGITVDKFIATFYSEYGVMCKSGIIRNILKLLENEGKIEVTRIPEKTPTGKNSTFFTEDKSKGHSVTIRSRQE